MVRYATLTWLLLLGASTFVLAPINGAAAVMWVLLAMPMLALGMRPELIKPYIICFGGVIGLYAIGIIAQWVFNATYTNPNFEKFHIWPMLDPNNAAAVLNFGLIPAFYMALRKSQWWILTALFALAMTITHSRAGVMAGGVACFIVAANYYGQRWTYCALGFLIFVALDLFAFWDSRLTPNMDSLWFRLKIWDNALEIVKAAGIAGYGLGSFPVVYQWIQHPGDPSVYFAHNDLLQLMAEGGWILGAGFIFLLWSVIIRTTKQNLLPATVMLAILIQSMFEFQFYVPVISILMGLALACHMNAGKKAYG
jgi:O-antigen ligase